MSGFGLATVARQATPDFGKCLLRTPVAQHADGPCTRLQTHELRPEHRRPDRQLKFTDTRLDEQARGISVKAMPMSLVLEGGTGKSFLINLTDCPGEELMWSWIATEQSGCISQVRRQW